MKRVLVLNSLLVICFLFVFQISQAVHRVPVQSEQVESIFDLNSDDLKHATKQELAQKMGRSLTVKEKVALSYVQKKLRKNTSLSATEALEEAKVNGLAIAGFVTGIVGLFVAGVILGTIAVVLGSIALKKIRKSPEIHSGKGLAIAALVLGIVAIVGGIVVLAIVI